MMSHRLLTMRERGRCVLPMVATLALVALGACGGSTQTNTPPTANAGPDMSANVGEMVHLNGSGSDAEGDNLTYSWTMSSRPTGSTATLQNATSSTSTFTPDVGGDYAVQLVVSDGSLSSAADECIVSANTPPTANAGPDQAVSVGDVVQLDGTGSSDPDAVAARTGASRASNAALAYLWTFDARPSGSTATLSSATSATPTFTADVAGTFVVKLVVNDGTVSSDPDLVTITVSQPQTTLYLRYGSSAYLSNQGATSGMTKVTLYGSGNSIDFPAVLSGGLTGTSYEFRLWLGSGTGSGQTGTWTAAILVQHNGSETTLATHAFSVPYNSNFVEYDATVTGISGGAAGDMIILRLTTTGVTMAAVLFGHGADSRIVVPGDVTVTQGVPPAGVVAGEGAGVTVEVHPGTDLRYSGG